MGQGFESDINENDNLPEDTRSIALNELREDTSIRQHALDQMREWIKKNPDIIHCRTDAPFLLRFLRTKKYSVPLAQEMLERYLIIRQLYPKWFRNLDVDDPVLSEILDQGFVIPLPERDEFGRKIILTRMGNFDTSKYTSDDMARVQSLVCESLMDDPENQIRGYTYIDDEGGMTMSHLSLWSVSDLRNMLRCLQDSTPMRHKCMTFVNVPSYANKFFELCLSMVSQKLKQRVTLHSSADSLKKIIDPKKLPKEYGGETPLADMIKMYKQELKQKKDELLALDDLKIDLNKKNKYLKEMEQHDISGLAGSFRKLEVD